MSVQAQAPTASDVSVVTLHPKFEHISSRHVKQCRVVSLETQFLALWPGAPVSSRVWATVKVGREAEHKIEEQESSLKYRGREKSLNRLL